jgi:hypothetical protein
MRITMNQRQGGLALNLWTADLMGIIPGGGSDVQTKKKNIYERAEG